MPRPVYCSKHVKRPAVATLVLRLHGEKRLVEFVVDELCIECAKKQVLTEAALAAVSELAGE